MNSCLGHCQIQGQPGVTGVRGQETHLIGNTTQLQGAGSEEGVASTGIHNAACKALLSNADLAAFQLCVCVCVCGNSRRRGTSLIASYVRRLPFASLLPLPPPTIQLLVATDQRWPTGRPKPPSLLLVPIACGHLAFASRTVRSVQVLPVLLAERTKGQQWNLIKKNILINFFVCVCECKRCSFLPRASGEMCFAFASSDP